MVVDIVYSFKLRLSLPLAVLPPLDEIEQTLTVRAGQFASNRTLHRASHRSCITSFVLLTLQAYHRTTGSPCKHLGKPLIIRIISHKLQNFSPLARLRTHDIQPADDEGQRLKEGPKGSKKAQRRHCYNLAIPLCAPCTPRTPCTQYLPRQSEAAFFQFAFRAGPTLKKPYPNTP
jgi:hypothetical protein